MALRWFLDDDERAFESEVRQYLRETATERSPLQYFMDRGGRTRQIYRDLGQRGWLGLAWPREFGGAERSEVYEFILWNELAYQRAARPEPAAGIIAKSLIAFGSDDQRQRFLPGIRLGEVGFSLGYSEPEAGSDLAGLRTRARRDGNEYVIAGEKRWTSDAHTADYLWLLCRTGEQQQRSRGLSVLIVPLDSPGITITPVPTIDGHPVNEVHLADVHVPAANLVGDEGRGWTVINEALARERHLQVMPGRLTRDLEDLEAWTRAAGRANDPVARRELERLRVDVALAEASVLAVLHAVVEGRDSLLLAARAKLIGSQAVQRMARLPVALGDISALSSDSPMEFLWRQVTMETIAGGTTEIMRDMIARSDLGVYG
jgi:alkylation response protein AidB-like acyl-CoA dehydrogenase